MRLTKQAVIWVLANLKELRAGEYPEMHLGYLERPLATRTRGHHAPFENPCLAAAEIEKRLKVCGRDGFLTKVHYCMEEQDEEIARSLSLPAEAVSKGVKDALSYITNTWPKSRGYKEFKERKRATSRRGSRYFD